MKPVVPSVGTDHSVEEMKCERRDDKPTRVAKSGEDNKSKNASFKSKPDAAKKAKRTPHKRWTATEDAYLVAYIARTRPVEPYTNQVWKAFMAAEGELCKI